MLYPPGILDGSFSKDGAILVLIMGYVDLEMLKMELNDLF